MEIDRIIQSCFRIKMDGKIIYIDPYKVPANSEKADIILITHPHPDHFDKSSMGDIQKEDTTVICPESCKKIIKKWNAKPINPNESTEIDGISIKTIPAYNIAKFFHKKKNNWVGYILQDKEKKNTVYHAGDTDVIPEMNELSKLNLDYAMIPCGGFFTMDIYEAANAIEEIKPKNVIPMHEKKANLDEFEQLIKNKSASINVIKLKPGENYTTN